MSNCSALMTGLVYCCGSTSHSICHLIGTLLRSLSSENVRTNHGEKLLHMVTTLAGWGVSNRDGNEICGIGNAPAFAPYLEMIVFRILRIGVSSFFGFRIFG